jgi:Tol biopolymer transport system component/predicted Ser/Thr protein kinase
MTPQQTIAHYRIVSKLGEGGMGEVYRATDTKLNRDVAIKILPAAFADDPDRLARFTREAQVLASLNHPNIAAIYGVEERALVMELVEGETLPCGLPVETALNYARQIAEALEYAHERGIIHRDLKPANIKVTPEGRVKVLDFGLAKALTGEPAAGNTVNSPTLTMGATVAGVILGTAGYMAPEQAKGKTVDKRADIWAFGIVLYEMLTGRPAYTGETVSETLAAVIKDPVDLSALPSGTPSSVRRLLHRCLEKDPRRRLRDIGDARLELDQPPDEPPAATPGAPARRLALLPWIVAAIFGIAAAILTFRHFRESAPSAPLMRFAVTAPENTRWGAWTAISPDGRYVGFTAYSADNKIRIWIRALDSFTSRMLPGTEGVNTFFWSPDSRWVAWAAGGKLKKIEIAGGPPQTLCNYGGVGLGGAWNSQDVILIGGTSSGILRVSASGGEAVPVTALTPDRDVMHVYPAFLSDGRHFFYARRTADRAFNISLGSLEVKPSEQDTGIVAPSTSGVSFGYAPPAPGSGSPGHLLFLRDGTLLAQTFDEKSLHLSGEPVPLAEAISTNLSRATFSVSPAGMLAFRTGSDSAGVAYQWFDRAGHVTGNAGESDHEDVALSFDSRILAHTFGGAPVQVALLDLQRGIDTRFTFNVDGASRPSWSPDGKWLAFSSVLGGSLYVKDAANSTPERKIAQTASIKYMNDWSRDGRFLVFTELSVSTGFAGLSILPDPLGSGESKPTVLTDPRFRESLGSFSPDSRWLAFVTDESTSPEIYVRPFPPGDGRSGRWRVSSAGGTEPRWRADGKEMYYISADGKLMAVDVTAAPTAPVFQSGVPHALFAAQISGSNFTFGYDVTRDGKRFLMTVPSAHGTPTPMTLVLNWQSTLRK